jgi:hypothetical protein
MLSDQFIVAGDDLDRDAAGRQRGQCRARILLGWIDEGRIAGEGEP